MAASLMAASWNKNPTFAAWSSTNPDNYTMTGSPTVTKLTSGQNYGAQALKLAIAAATDNVYATAGTAEFRTPSDESYSVIEWEVTLDSGTSFAAAGIQAVVAYASGSKSYTVNLNTEHASPTAGRTYRGAKVIAAVNSSPTGAPASTTMILSLNRTSVHGGSAAAKTITFHRVVVRKATAEEFDTMTARGAYASIDARITATDSAWVTNAAAQAASLSFLTANVAGANATLTTQAGAISTLQGKTAAYFDIIAAAGADPAYLKMNATSFGSNIMLAASSIGLFNTSGGGLTKIMEIVSNAARFSAPVEIQIGTSKLVVGPNFGASSNLVMWFGSNIAQSSMTTSNSTFHLKNDGSAYFGGTLSAGVLRNSGQSSGLSSTEEFILGPFGTNTGSKSVTVSWSYGITATRDTNPTTRTQNVAATVTLYRSIAGGSYTQVANGTVSAGGSWTVTSYGDAETPNPLGGSSGVLDYIAEGIQQLSFTYTDTNTSSGDFRYKAVLSRSGTFTASGTAIGSDVFTQRLGIVSIE